MCLQQVALMLHNNEMPRMAAFAASKSGVRSRNPCPCTVQPGVDALGYHQRTTHLPDRSERDTERPSWSCTENAGAVLPISSMSTFLRTRIGRSMRRGTAYPLPLRCAPPKRDCRRTAGARGVARSLREDAKEALGIDGAGARTNTSGDIGL